MEYRCLLWDFDGTLADTGSDVWNSLTYAARRAGGAIDDLYMRDDANLADPMDEIMRHVIPYPGEAYLETFDEDVRVHYRTLNDFFSDIEAARTNGISCIAVTYGDGDEIALLSRNPAYVARDIAELNDIMTDTVIHARSMI